MIVFQISLNFDPAKEKIQIRCRIYILMKKVVIPRKIQGTMKTFTLPFFKHLSLSLNRKKRVIRQKAVVLFPEICRVKIFLSLIRGIVECVSEYTFSISKNNKQTNKKNRIKKGKRN